MRRRSRSVPFLAVVLGVAGVVVFAVLPVAGLLWRAPWHRVVDELRAPEALTALRLSLLTSTAALAVSMVVGIPLAWWLARGRMPGRSIVRALAVAPMVLPPVVGGVALLFAFGRNGLAGSLLERWFGIRLPFTTGAAILAQTFVAMPFLVLTVESALRGLDRRYEEAAATLGAGRWRTFARVAVPLIAPSVLAGAALTWARALGEFGATITFAGSVPGRTQTLPLAVYAALESRPDAAIALSVLLLAISVLIVALVLPGARRGWSAGATAP